MSFWIVRTPADETAPPGSWILVEDEESVETAGQAGYDVVELAPPGPLREALRPFAEYAARLESPEFAEYADEEEIESDVTAEGRELLVGDFRRARALLKKEEER